MARDKMPPAKAPPPTFSSADTRFNPANFVRRNLNNQVMNNQVNPMASSPFNPSSQPRPMAGFPMAGYPSSPVLTPVTQPARFQAQQSGSSRFSNSSPSRFPSLPYIPPSQDSDPMLGSATSPVLMPGDLPTRSSNSSPFSNSPLHTSPMLGSATSPVFMPVDQPTRFHAQQSGPSTFNSSRHSRPLYGPASSPVFTPVNQQPAVFNNSSLHTRPVLGSPSSPLLTPVSQTTPFSHSSLHTRPMFSSSSPSSSPALTTAKQPTLFQAQPSPLGNPPLQSRPLLGSPSSSVLTPAKQFTPYQAQPSGSSLFSNSSPYSCPIRGSPAASSAPTTANQLPLFQAQQPSGSPLFSNSSPHTAPILGTPSPAPTPANQLRLLQAQQPSGSLPFSNSSHAGPVFGTSSLAPTPANQLMLIPAQGNEHDAGMGVQIKQEPDSDDDNVGAPVNQEDDVTHVITGVRIKQEPGMDDINVDGPSTQQDMQSAKREAKTAKRKKKKKEKLEKRIDELKERYMKDLGITDMHQKRPRYKLRKHRVMPSYRKLREEASAEIVMETARIYAEKNKAKHKGGLDGLDGLGKRLKRRILIIQEQRDLAALERLKSEAKFNFMSQNEKDAFLLAKLCNRCGAYHNSDGCTILDREKIARPSKRSLLAKTRDFRLEELNEMRMREDMHSLNEGVLGMDLKEQYPLPDYDVSHLDLEAK
ncbi:uncharacterized protein K452DRAFT_357841 [Aplosporella prunicola CBS 121167]|uniref:Uncharacterized protein n=1 Tax=Aplosporella prunicola CBS 121167 TaxID=1176127 RepID=A0A6A6BEZ8_9PEZI|nr:uncharacterized protein K452DRAFT_357841 [Aplosporella prunicola CBS 121167]KAF2142742.1 hypothetical protein K452DRAFT_357841 [Aplosporella prunicola CBS 121167]